MRGDRTIDRRRLELSLLLDEADSEEGTTVPAARRVLDFRHVCDRVTASTAEEGEGRRMSGKLKRADEKWTNVGICIVTVRGRKDG